MTVNSSVFSTILSSVMGIGTQTLDGPEDAGTIISEYDE